MRGPAIYPSTLLARRPDLRGLVDLADVLDAELREGL